MHSPVTIAPYRGVGRGGDCRNGGFWTRAFSLHVLRIMLTWENFTVINCERIHLVDQEKRERRSLFKNKSFEEQSYRQLSYRMKTSQTPCCAFSWNTFSKYVSQWSLESSNQSLPQANCLPLGIRWKPSQKIVQAGCWNWCKTTRAHCWFSPIG